MISLPSISDYSSFSPFNLVKSLWVRDYKDFRLILEQSDELHYFYIRSNTQRLLVRVFLCACLAVILTISSLSIYSVVSIWRYEKLVSSKVHAEQKRKEAFEALKALSNEPQNLSEDVSDSRLIEMARNYKNDLNKTKDLLKFSNLEIARANKTLELGLKASGMSYKEIEMVKKDVSERFLLNNDATNENSSARIPESLNKTLLLNKKLNSFISSFPSTAPVSYAIISSKFGPRFHPIKGKSLFHSGLDYVPTIDFYAKSTLAGTVEAVNFDDHGYGNTVTLMHSNDIKTSYSHLSSVFVKPGQKITQGTSVGKIGNTGLSSGTHLHFEIMNNKTKINPSIIMAMSKNVQ